MGLALNKGDRVYFDSNILIFAIENHPVYAPIIKTIFDEIWDKSALLVTSELSLSETLVKPIRDNNPILIQTFKTFLMPNAYFNVFPITRDILIQSAEVRVTSRLKTPDAIHLATALSLNCRYFITNDKAIKPVEHISTLSLDELT